MKAACNLACGNSISTPFAEEGEARNQGVAGGGAREADLLRLRQRSAAPHGGLSGVGAGSF